MPHIYLVQLEESLFISDASQAFCSAEAKLVHIKSKKDNGEKEGRTCG